ncbi:hypothetical protein D3C73_1617620 [compost metagenome]
MRRHDAKSGNAQLNELLIHRSDTSDGGRDEPLAPQLVVKGDQIFVARTRAVRFDVNLPAHQAKLV